MRIAMTREVSDGIARCELSHLDRVPIDAARAREQHDRYEALLAELGCEVRRLGAGPDLPDSVFIEDMAVVLDEVAVITRPGALSRRAEQPEVERALGALRPFVRIEPPATLDGGDILEAGRTIYAGLTERTNEAGVAQLGALLGPYGYTVRGVKVSGCLHLKTAVCLVAEGALLINPEWVDTAALRGMELLAVNPSEPMAANALLVGDTVVYRSAYPATLRRLEARGLRVAALDMSELAKAEGGVTCCCLLFEA